MGGHFLLTAFIIRLLRIVRFDLDLKYRRREVVALREDIARRRAAADEFGSPDGMLVAEGVIRVHEVGPGAAFDFYALCSQPVRSVTGGRAPEVTCRGCRRVRRRAERT